MGLSENLLLMKGHCPFGECLFGSVQTDNAKVKGSDFWHKRKYGKQKSREAATISSVLYEDSEEVWDISSVYQTDVYEADPDGSNRRKTATFSGSIEFPALPRAAVLAEGKLYFGGPTEVRERVELDLQSGGQKITTWVSAAVYCPDLNDYTIETFILMEDKEGPSVYLYQIYEYDGMIYWMIRFSQDDSSYCIEAILWKAHARKFCVLTPVP